MALCRSCGASIRWEVTAKGRSAPFDQDGISHFATCPDADRFRGREREVVKMPFEVTAYVPKVPAGPYQAVCTNCETRAAKDGSGEFRVWEFTLRDGTGRTVGATSSLSTTPKSKGGKWLAALLGHAPVVGETVDPIGKPCTILVELNDDGYERVAYVTAPEQAAAKPGPSFAQTPEAVAVPTLPTRVIPADSDDLPF